MFESQTHSDSAHADSSPEPAYTVLVNCSGQGLTTFPSLPGETTVLDLSYNLLDQVATGLRLGLGCAINCRGVDITLRLGYIHCTTPAVDPLLKSD